MQTLLMLFIPVGLSNFPCEIYCLLQWRSKACQTLCDYAILVEKIRINRQKSDSLEDAVNLAVEQCIKEDILKDFLLKHRGEVTDMVLFQYDEEAYIKSEKEISYEDGYNQAQLDLQPILVEKDAKLLEKDEQLHEKDSQIQHLQQMIEQLSQR